MTDVNIFDLIPERIAKYEESGEGLITILKPKFRNKIFVKYLLPRMKSPNFKVNLDQFGSFVWNQCNGKNTVEQIGILLRDEFQGDIEPVYDRLAVFIQSLARYRFIEYKNFNSKLLPKK